jgi:hypothetical protein
MLYQLSYASPAQTEQNYHTGNRIASELLTGPASLMPAAYLSVPIPFLECPILQQPP